MGKFRYQHITSSVKDKIPENLYTAEIAVNTYPGFEKLYFKNANNEVVSVMTSTQVINLIQSGMTDNTYFDGAEYDSNTKKINFKHGDTVEAFIDATDFIKDGMVDNVVIKEIEVPGGDPQKVLAITFNTDAGKEEIDIRLDDIFNPDNYYTKIEINEITNNINSSITEIEGDVVNIYSAITNIEGDIIDINSAITEINSALTENYYTKDEINEIELTISAALNDLDKRKIDQETLDELELIISAALNDLDKRKVGQETLDEMELTISAALNDLDRRKIGQETIDELELTISAALNDLDKRKVEQETLDEMELTISAALNDLNLRKLDIGDYNPIRLDNFNFDEVDKNIKLYYTDKDGEQSLSCDLSYLDNAGVTTIDSMSYDSSEDVLYLYFTNSEGEQSITCNLEALDSSDIPMIDGMFSRSTSSSEYIIGVTYHYRGEDPRSHWVEEDISGWLNGCIRSVGFEVDYEYPFPEGEYIFRTYNQPDKMGEQLWPAYNADEWFEHFYETKVPNYASTSGTEIRFYSENNTYLFSADYVDTNDNDFMTNLQYSNDSGKTLTAYNTNGNFSVTLDNLALDDEIISGMSASTSYGRNESLYLWRKDGKAVSAVVSTWFDYYANKLSGDSIMQTITLYNDHSQYCSSTVDLSSWFMNYVTNNDFSSFTTTTSSNVSTISGYVNTLYSSANTWNSLNSSYTNHEMDNCKHVTCDLQNYWNAKIGYAYYDPHYYDGTNTYPAIVFKTDSGGTMTTVSVINATDFIKDGMVSNVYISSMNNELVIEFNTDAGKQDIKIPLSSIFDPTNYYSKNDVDTLLMGYATTSVTNAITGDVSTISGNVSTLQSSANTFSNDIYSLQQSANTFSTDISNLNRDVTGLTGTVQNLTGDVQTISGNVSTLTSDVQTISGNVSTLAGDVQTISGNVSTLTGDVQSLQTNKLDSSAFTAHTADTTIHFTANDLISSGFVTTSYSAKTVTDSITNDDYSPVTSNAVYDWTDGVKLKKITQSAYDALVQAGTVDQNTLYIITD